MFLLMAFLPSLVFIAAIFFVPEKRYQYKDSKKTTEVKSISKARDWIIVLIVNLIIVLLLLKLNSRYLEMETLHFLLLFGPALILASLTYVLRRALNKKIIFCILFLFWWDFSLALGGTPFFYYKTEALGFSKVFMGLLGTLGSAGGFFGAWFFMKISRKRIFWGEKPLIELSLEKMLFYSLFVGIATILSSFLVVGAKSAMVLDISFGFIFMFSHLTILVLAAKFCPPQIEGTFFALLMSVINLGASISERVSGMLYKFLHSAASPELANNIPAQVLVWIGWPTQWAVKKPTEGINLFGLYYAAFWLIIMSLGAFCFYFFAIRRFGESIKEEKELEVLNISKLFSENNKNK
jgi:MFS family permease